MIVLRTGMDYSTSLCEGFSIFLVNCFLCVKQDMRSISSVQFSHSVVSDSLRLHESQHARPPCPSPTPGGLTQTHMFFSPADIALVLPLGSSSCLCLSLLLRSTLSAQKVRLGKPQLYGQQIIYFRTLRLSPRPKCPALKHSRFSLGEESETTTLILL